MANLDVQDSHIGIRPGEYEWYEGMDRRPLGDFASSDPILGSMFVTNIGLIISASGFAGFQTGLHFGAQ